MPFAHNEQTQESANKSLQLGIASLFLLTTLTEIPFSSSFSIMSVITWLDVWVRFASDHQFGLLGAGTNFMENLGDKFSDEEELRLFCWS